MVKSYDDMLLIGNEISFEPSLNGIDSCPPVSFAMEMNQIIKLNGHEKAVHSNKYSNLIFFQLIQKQMYTKNYLLQHTIS